MEMDSYLKMVNKEREQYIAEEVRPAAEKRLKRSLVLDEISHRENIQLSQEDMNAAFSATIQQLQQSPNKGKKDKVSQETVNNMTYSTLNRIYNQRILDRLKDIATGQAEAKAQAEAVAETEAETPAEPVAEEPVAAEEPEATEQPKEE
jgi:trigger factor